jgi:dephospho-CoA kinase
MYFLTLKNGESLTRCALFLCFLQKIALHMDFKHRIGITGGIGSGKTTVCRLFEALGIPVYDADYWAKWLIGHDEALRTGIVNLLGPEAYATDGTYNRAYVAGIVFKDKEKLAALNALVHPAVEQHSRAWHEAEMAKGAPYTLREAALLVESGGHRHVNALIVVTAPENIRIQRVMQRDGTDEAMVRARMAAQLPESEKVKLADFVIVNDGTQLLGPQVWAVHRAVLNNKASKDQSI